VEFVGIEEGGEVLIQIVETDERIAVARLLTATSKPGIGSRSEVGV